MFNREVLYSSQKLTIILFKTSEILFKIVLRKETYEMITNNIDIFFKFQYCDAEVVLDK